MLQAAFLFFVLAIISYVFGANAIAGVSMDIGRAFLFIFLLLSVVSFIGGMMSGKREKKL